MFKRIFIMLATVILISQLAVGQAVVSLDHVDGLENATTIASNTPVTFYIRLANSTGETITAFGNGFRIYSPDGAMFQPMSYDTTNLSWRSRFDLIFNVAPAGIDGFGADSVSFSGVSLIGSGFPAGFNQIGFTLTTTVDASEAGKTICLDSVASGTIGWQWSSFSNSYEPDWSGPHCYTVGGGSPPIPGMSIDSIVVTPAVGTPEVYPPDEVPPFERQSTVVVFGTANYASSQPIANSWVEVFDGVSYANHSGPVGDGIHNVATDDNGKFSYQVEMPTADVTIAQLYCYWFSCEGYSIPIILPFAGSCTLLECLSNELAGELLDIAEDLTYLPDGSVLSIGSNDNPLTIQFPNYPPEPTVLGSYANDTFFEGYANLYAGPIDRAFLGPNAGSWLDRGLEASDASTNDIANQLHTLATTKADGWWQPVVIKENGRWRSISREELTGKYPEFDWGKVNWASIGIGAVTCGVGSIVSAGTLALAACAPLAVTIATETIIKQELVPMACDQVFTQTDPTLCRDLGELGADGLALAASLPYSFLPNNNVGQFANYFNMAKDPLKQAYWGAQYINHVAGYIDLAGTYWEIGEAYSTYYPQIQGGFKEALALRDMNIMSVAVGALQGVPLQVIGTDRRGARFTVAQHFDSPVNPTSLQIEVKPARAIYGPVVNPQPQAPIGQLLQGGSALNITWLTEDNDNLDYTATIPLASMPNYNVGQPYSAQTVVEGTDLFGNSSSDGTGSMGLAEYNQLGLSLYGPDNSGIHIPPAALTWPAFITRWTDFNYLVGHGPGGKNTLDSIVILSEVTTVFAPETLSLDLDATVTLPYSPESVDPLLAAGVTISVGRWNQDNLSYDILPSSVDLPQHLISTQTNRLGRFVVLAVDSVFYNCGDIDNSGGAPDLSDLIYLVNYLFVNGPAPEIIQSSNVNGTGGTDLSDLIYLVNFLFLGGAAVQCP